MVINFSLDFDVVSLAATFEPDQEIEVNLDVPVLEKLDEQFGSARIN